MENVFALGFDSWSLNIRWGKRIMLLPCLHPPLSLCVQDTKLTVWSAVMSCWQQGRHRLLTGQRADYITKAMEQGHCVGLKIAAVPKPNHFQRGRRGEVWIPLKLSQIKRCDVKMYFLWFSVWLIYIISKITSCVSKHLFLSRFYLISSFGLFFISLISSLLSSLPVLSFFYILLSVIWSQSLHYFYLLLFSLPTLPPPPFVPGPDPTHPLPQAS